MASSMLELWTHPNSIITVYGSTLEQNRHVHSMKYKFEKLDINHSVKLMRAHRTNRWLKVSVTCATNQLLSPSKRPVSKAVNNGRLKIQSDRWVCFVVLIFPRKMLFKFRFPIAIVSVVSPGLYTQKEAEEGLLIRRSNQGETKSPRPVNYPVGKPLEVKLSIRIEFRFDVFNV